MSVPHLDTRVVDGQASVLFGPFATFSPKFLKNGSNWDIVTQVRPSNLFSMLKVAATNFDLIKYLVSELLKNHSRKVQDLRELMPDAKDEDWTLRQAGQRAQVMHNGKLQFGTEVITSADGSISGLLGASPGASTAVPIMLGLLKRCFADEYAGWEPRLRELIPTLGEKLNDQPELAKETFEKTSAALSLQS
jgi:malate dehydrogenase (quinone)